MDMIGGGAPSGRRAMTALTSGTPRASGGYAASARTSGGGNVAGVPTQAISVGPVETWKADRVSIWHAGTHDNSFGMRLTTLMISKSIVDSSVPMSLLADHPDVRFSFYRPAIGTCDAEMH